MVFRNATEVVIACENSLGCALDVSKAPLWTARQKEAGILIRRMADRPGLYTFENLTIAVEYCRKKKKTIARPSSLLSIIEDALVFAAKPPVQTSLGINVSAAQDFELSHPDLPDQSVWLRRLVRTQGRAREETLKEWAEARKEYL